MSTLQTRQTMNIHQFVDLHHNAEPDSYMFDAHTMKCFGNRLSWMKVQRTQIETHWHKAGVYDGNNYQETTIVIDSWRLVTGGKHSCVHYFTIDGFSIGTYEKEV